MPTITTVDATWANGVAMDEAELRRADSAMFLGDGSNNGVRGGIVRHGDNSLAVSVNGSDQVTVQSGAVVIPAATGLGVYRAALSAATSAVGLSSRNATNPRIDLVVMQIVSGQAVVQTVDGTPGASPSAPALPANAVELARLTVPALGGGAVTVSNAFRSYATGLGGTLHVETAARLPGSGNTKGQRAIALDTGAEHLWDGAAWVPTAWTTFTLQLVNLPTIPGSSYAIFKRIGDRTEVQFAAVASGAATGVVTMTLPTTAVIRFGTNNQLQSWGTAIATDTSVPASRPVVVRCNSSSTAAFLLPDGSNNINATAPFTWVSGDTLAGSFSYESA